MSDRESIISILTESLTKEQLAQHNCEEILLELRKNGFTEQIEEIKNDEIRHQELIKKLQSML